MYNIYICMYICTEIVWEGFVYMCVFSVSLLIYKIYIDHIFCFSLCKGGGLYNLFTQADAMQKLRDKYADDPDALFGPWGVKFIGPKGREEDEQTHLFRLNHNARMRFNRSFVSGMG